MNPIIRMLKKSTEDYVAPGTPLLKSSSSSRIGLIVPELIFKYGDAKNHIRKFPRILPWLVPAVTGRFKGYRSLKNNPSRPKTRVEEGFVDELIGYAKGIGCHDVGFVEVSGDQIFKNKSVLYSHAIVLSMPMAKERMAEAPGIKAGQEVWRIYDRLGDASNKVAAFLRRNGYAAQAGAALGGDTNYPLLAQEAGLGWIGKHGLLISPQTGPSQRLAVVYTSIENLPPARENLFGWIGDYCEKCNKCVRKCPAGAIYKEKPVQPDGNPQHIDYMKCIGPFTKSMGCSVCIRECVFFEGDFEKIRKSFRG